MENSITPKSFWSKPEGKPGMVLLAGIIVGAGYLLYKFLPYVIELLKNIYYTIFLGIGLFIIWTLLSDKRFRTLIAYLYKGAMRGLTSIFITLNPIAILESYVEDLHKKLEKIEEQISVLKGQSGKLERNIQEKRSECEHEYALAKAAQEKKKTQAEIALHTMKAERLKEYVTKLTTLYKKIEILYNVLSKMKTYSAIMAEQTEFEVKLRKEEYVSIKAAHSAMKTAFNIIKGNDDAKEIFNQTMDYIVDDMGTKIGEMERMLDASMDFINNVDLENAVFEDRGIKMLEEIDAKGFESIFGKIDDKALNQNDSFSKSFGQINKDFVSTDSISGQKTTNKYLSLDEN